ncbi:hypothetical protein NQ314_002636 [Rhamnusium bicolor]|uniref:Tudor domain-containing protein n=1 Tax=Rhamnusium bicolor TaxID=1586634 RepID=A0AAV8ZP71_9CUCU|nr:hypothetical protein NQ314_002636 [Rhamnusium bicolor]
MAPSHSRQLLAWTLPTIAVLLSYLWYKKKRIGARSDTGDTKTRQDIERSQLDKTLQKGLGEADKSSPVKLTPTRNFSRSLSGVDSAPIDIIIPPQLRSAKSHPIVISDEDLDLEIEKIKSMKNGALSRSKSDYSPPQAPTSKSPSPIKANSQNNKENLEKETSPMAQKDIAVVEDKLTSLKLYNNKEIPRKREHKNNINNKREHDELQRQSSERDSANHSPADVMLASPSLSSISDNHSERLGDTSTVSYTRHQRFDPENNNLLTFYEFVIPQGLVGRLIGRRGGYVIKIKDTSNAHVLVKKHPTNSKFKVCSVEGTQSEIDKALKMIRDKFPLKRYPEVTLEQVHFTPLVPTVPLIPDHLYLKLVEGINNDTILSCIVAPNHLFLQQPTHPSFPSLNLLCNYMNMCYTESVSPMLPTPIPENTVCAAYSVDAWYRAMVLSTDIETDTSYVKFLDFGGYAYLENSKLRQIRGDFMLLPFQAAECCLANVKSLEEDGTWPEGAYNLIADITKGAIIFTQVADYTEDGLPLVLCFVVVGPQPFDILHHPSVNFRILVILDTKLQELAKFYTSKSRSRLQMWHNFSVHSVYCSYVDPVFSNVAVSTLGFVRDQSALGVDGALVLLIRDKKYFT